MRKEPINYTTIELNSFDEWCKYRVPKKGAYRVILNIDGVTQIESYYFNGKFHRENDMPAQIWYYANGHIERAAYFINGCRNREIGKPQIVYYNEIGEIEREHFVTSNLDVEIYFDGNISIGSCQRYSLSYWLDNWQFMCKKRKFSNSEANEYKQIFDFIQSRTNTV